MIKVFTANRPPLKEYDDINELSAIEVGEIYRVALKTGNHWRKIFNVYAKLMYSLAVKESDKQVLFYKTWQRYRDEKLLQECSSTQLHFNHDGLGAALSIADPGSIRIVMGKAFAESVLASTEVIWMDKDFAINKKLAIVVCPYFDYRQLSNVKIETLAKLVSSLISLLKS